MLQRLVLFTNFVTAGAFLVGTGALPVMAQTTVVPVLSEPVVPESLPPASPLLVAPPPAGSAGFDFDLPTPGDSPRSPVYDEKPQKPDVLPLRLEIRLSQRRVTVYRGKTPVKSYAIAVGKPGWETPKGTYKVQQMFRNPTWIHPLKKGITIPGGDPENPLGRYWIGFWTDGKNWIGFHGTPNPKSVGTAASHGCIRMYNQDIEELFQKVSLGMEVKVVQ
jgi:hypothetical protein